jgi:hypothetical protein
VVGAPQPVSVPLFIGLGLDATAQLEVTSPPGLAGFADDLLLPAPILSTPVQNSPAFTWRHPHRETRKPVAAEARAISKTRRIGTACGSGSVE